MSIESVLARGRGAAERIMQDACTIRRKTGESMDPVTLQMVPVYTTLYSGKCRVQITSTLAGSVMPEAGERVVAVQRLQVQVPVIVTGVAVDDEVVVSAAKHDPDLVGRVYRVRSEFAKTHATSRRLECEEAQT